MKKYIFSLFTAALLVFCAGCSKDDQVSIDSGVVGEWHLTTWNNEAHADFDVYMELLSTGTFHIYQKVETSNYVKYSGDFRINGSLFSGRYSDGEAWSTDYTVSLSNDGKTLTMTSNTNSAVVSVYTKTTIPTEVRNVSEVRSISFPEAFQRIL